MSDPIDPGQPSEGTTPAPLLRVVSGNPTPEELAALVAVVGTIGAAAPASPDKPVRAWSAPHRLVRTSLPHGPGGWRASGLPR